MNVFEAIRSRYAQLLWSGNFYHGVLREQPLDESLVPGDIPGTWYWPDVDYANQDRANWRAAAHYRRLQTAIMVAGPQRLREDPVFTAKIIGALEYWLQKRFTNPNWWHNDIGVPRNIADILLLLYPVLPRDVLIRGAALVGTGSMATRPEISEKWTGANLIWGASNTIKHAILVEDGALLCQAVERAAKELEIARDGQEGIQPDGSFYQHGPRLYSGGYGRSFADEISQMTYCLQQTPYQFPKTCLDSFLVHILDGLQFMSRGDSLDYACIGREFTRFDAVRAGKLKDALQLMTKTADMPRQPELAAYLDAMNGGKALHCTKYFPQVALLCHHMDGVYVGAKFATDQIWDAEICNGEGELCYNMSYGTHTCIMHDGSEYLDIAPLWDYARIPGTTARTESDEQLLAHRDWWCAPLPNSHYGGMQKENRAVIYELAQHDGVEAYVSDFAFDGGFVSLGTGIQAVPDEQLVTTVDQCHLQGSVQEKDNSVIHHQIRYTGLDGTVIHWEEKEVTGSWQRNNFTTQVPPATGTVLTLYIPQEKNRYAYMISAAERTVPEVEVLRNDTSVQAIRLADGSVMAVFHEEGNLEVDRRCIHGNPGILIEV